VAEALGVDASGLCRPVRRPQERGQISKDGVHLRPAEQTAESSGDQAAAAATAGQEQPAAQAGADASPTAGGD
jgi:hypothetical protein